MGGGTHDTPEKAFSRVWRRLSPGFGAQIRAIRRIFQGLARVWPGFGQGLVPAVHSSPVLVTEVLCGLCLCTGLLLVDTASLLGGGVDTASGVDTAYGYAQ